MITLNDNQGIPLSLMWLMAIMAGVTVANLYYNQPLLEEIRRSVALSETQAGGITVVTQVGYALGLLLLIPLGDLTNRRRLIIANLLLSAVMAALMAKAQSGWMLWGASLLLGASSVTPQFFMPIAGQYSRPERKAQNMGLVLSGLLTGILASRVVSGLVGEWVGWRAMFAIASAMMLVCAVVCHRFMPVMPTNFSGSYGQLMRSVGQIVMRHAEVRVYALRASMGFGSMLAVWACLAFHLEASPLHGGSAEVGLLGLCGIAGALMASGIGRFISRWGIRRFSILGATIQLASWGVAWQWGDSYVGLAAAIILVDIGLQCQQLSNQSGCLQAVKGASSRTNTIFMTTYFVGGALGTWLAGQAWTACRWNGVCAVGAAMAAASIAISMLARR